MVVEKAALVVGRPRGLGVDVVRHEDHPYLSLVRRGGVLGKKDGGFAYLHLYHAILVEAERLGHENDGPVVVVQLHLVDSRLREGGRDSVLRHFSDFGGDRTWGTTR